MEQTVVETMQMLRNSKPADIDPALYWAGQMSRHAHFLWNAKFGSASYVGDLLERCAHEYDVEIAKKAHNSQQDVDTTAE